VEESSTTPGPSDNAAANFAAARAGSTEALGQLLDQFRHYLLDIANAELDALLRNKVGPSDIVQETFLEAQRIFQRFEGESPTELRAWLRAILLNKIGTTTRHYRDAAKRQAGREVAFSPDSDRQAELEQSGPTPSRMMMAHERATALRSALLRLPEHYRQLIVWRQMEDLSFDDIAARLGKSIEAVRKLWSRAIQQLQVELGESL
jgi:RNA polymerase sigma-70 factor (ECF subfamily)